ncbi:MAG: Fe-S cluster assembly protein SufB [Candidatus Hydrothermales bacterium]
MENIKDTLIIDLKKYDFKDEVDYLYRAPKGLTKKLIEEISYIKNEPEWMRKFRLNSFEIFLKKPMPQWGPDLSEINFDEISYYVRPTDRRGTSWDEVPEYIKKTFEKLGIPEAERKFLAGLGAQYDSEVVYHNIRRDLEKKGVIFLDTDTALKEYPEFFKEYFGKVVPPSDNKFAALNSAVWSGGSFIYVPKNVHVEFPLQAYFRINAANIGQFERTLIIADEGSFVHYIEGCTAPTYSTFSLHAAVVEIIAKRGSRVRYTTIQNWATNIYNLVTKRAVAYQDAVVEWIDGNIGSKVTMKYPCVIMKEKGARADIISVAYAGRGQHQDTGAKAIHLAPYTSSKIISKSISKDGGRATYRGLLKIIKGAKGVKSNVNCDALLLDEFSRTDTYPYMEINEEEVDIGHEASVGRISEEEIFYVTSRGIRESEALALIVLGFIEPLTKELPMEYAVELNRLIQLEMEGSVG